MADNTLIEWADATVNAVNGCSVVSPGCTNCYAMKLAGTRLRHHPSRAGLTDQTKAGPVWNGKVRLNEDQLLQPLRWKRPRRIFWNAHGDLFHDAVPDEWIARVFAVCALTPQHQHLILTKRSARMRDYIIKQFMIGAGVVMEAAKIGGISSNAACLAVLGVGEHVPESKYRPLPNVWLGVSVEDQARADQRIPDLLATPAAVRFISAEPLLGQISLGHIAVDLSETRGIFLDALDGYHWGVGNTDELPTKVPNLDWVIVGGESGPGARPMDTDWARSLRDQCQAAGVPFFFKQHGEWIGVDCLTNEQRLDAGDLNKLRADPLTGSVWIGKKDAGRLLDGREWSEVPA